MKPQNLGTRVNEIEDERFDGSFQETQESILSKTPTQIDKFYRRWGKLYQPNVYSGDKR